MLGRFDAKLLALLDFNARMPLSVMARRLRTSKQVCKYHLDSLSRNGVLRGFYADVDPSRLGLSIYLVYLRFQRMPDDVWKDFVKHVGAQEGVGVNASLSGSWDHCLGIWARGPVGFQKTYDEVMERYERYVKQKSITVETEFHYYKPESLFGSRSDAEISMTGSGTMVKTDDVDMKIISELSKDARAPLTAIARMVGVGPASVKHRMRRLETEGAILGYRVMIDYSKLGLLYCRVFLRLEGAGEKGSILQYLKQSGNVISATQTIGFCDLEFRAIVNDLDEMQTLIRGLKSFRSFSSHEVVFYQKVHESLNYFPFSS